MLKNVLIFCLENIDNAGDEILGATTEFLLRNNVGGINIVRRQLMPKWKKMELRYRIIPYLNAPLFLLAKKLKGNSRYKVLNYIYKCKYEAYYEDCIKEADYVVYAIGMFKYSTQDFSYVFSMINRIAEKYRKPVLISAASVEKRNDSDWRSQQLVDAFNVGSLKVFTTRDGESGLKRLNEEYKRGNTIVDFVGDPALWVPECYGVQRKSNINKEVPYIGVNLIRSKIYKAYGGRTTPEQVRDFYKGLICLLETKGVKWSLFCNGMREDYVEGLRLIEEMGLQPDKLLPCPKDATEYVNMMLGFDCIFGARLHACLTAYSLNIPVAGLLWDNKLECFSQSMGIRHLFTAEDDLNPEYVVSKIFEALEYTSDYCIRDDYRAKTVDYIKRFFSLT